MCWIGKESNKKNNSMNTVNKQPTSFVDLCENFTKEFQYPIISQKLTTAPIYLVNKLSGKITTVDEATIIDRRKEKNGDYCSINPHISSKNNFVNVLQFTIREENKHDNKLINVIWGKLFVGNYVIFLDKKDAAQYTLELLTARRDKLDKEIEKLYDILYGENS